MFFFLGMSESPFADSCSRIPGADSDPGRQPPLLNNNNKHNFLSLDRRTCLFYKRVWVRCPQILRLSLVFLLILSEDEAQSLRMALQVHVQGK